MAKKPEPIVRLAAQTARQIFANSGNYMAFLTTAAHNFKYSFRDQLLIYAQKPDATACAETDFWNKHGRWVNKGTTGIALLVDTDKGYKLRHVFDMSDTNSRAGRTVPVWQMRPQYEGPVVEALENSYGEFSDKSDFAACLLETAKVIVEDNFGDYYADLCRVKEGSLLEELDDLNTEVWFKGLLENSVAYIMLTRCGIDPQEHFSGEDFARIYDFNTLKTLAILGAAASDIAEMPLREIASTVLPLYWEEEKQNRTFAQRPIARYNDSRTKSERSVEHGADIQNRGRLSTAQPGRAGGPAGRKIWDAAAQLPGESPARDLHGDAADRGAEQPSGGNRPAGHRDGGAVDGANGAGTGRDREPESVRSDEVGGSDEQHQGSGGGSGAGGVGVRQLTDPLPAAEEPPQAPTAPSTAGSIGLEVKHHDFSARSDVDYYYQDSEKNELLRTCDALKNNRVEIAAFFAEHTDSKERGDFIKAFFNNTYVEKILTNGQRAGYRAWDDVLTLWRGPYLSREREVFMRWTGVADTIYGMILLDQWLDPDERPLPSEAEQISFIEQAEAEKASAFTIPQEAIDYILCGGSGISEGKYRIYEQFQKKEDKQENIKFLRDEYGIGGRSDAIPGSGYWEDHDGKGITISRDYGDPDGKFLLTWAKVEKRIGELIAADRYLNRAEKEHYPVYQAQLEERKARWAIAKEISSIIDDYVDFKTQLGEKGQCAEVLFAKRCADSFGVGDKKCYVLTKEGSFVLPTLRDTMQTIIRDNTHLTERCEAMLTQLSGPLAAPLEPTYDELNPPPPPKKEYRFALGDTVYLGAQEYELLAYDEQTVRLFDPAFPIINKELPRAEFDRMLAENPLNDRLLQVVEDISPTAEQGEPDTPQTAEQHQEERTDTPSYNLGFGHLGNGVTVWNRLELRDGDYKTIAHIAPDRTVTYYEDGLPEDVQARIEEFAATSTMTISATQDAPVFSTPPREREPVSGRFWDDYNSTKNRHPDSLLLYQVGDFFELYGGSEGEDAQIAASELGLALTTRTIPDIGRVSMCGFPAHALEDNVVRLTAAGHDVIVASLEDNRHKITAVPAAPTERAKRLINEFCEKEYNSPADFSNLRDIALAHSATGDGEHFVDVSADLTAFRLTYQVDGESVASIQCHDLDDLTGLLANLDFDEMIAFAEEQYGKQREQATQQGPGADDFSDIDPAAIRAALVENGIVDGHVVDPDKLEASPFIQQVMTDVELLSHADISQPEEEPQKQDAPNNEGLTELQKKAAEIARKYESLPMQDKIGIIAQAFGCTSGKIEMSPCYGKWRGTSDVSIRFDNGTSLFIGNRRTPKAKTAKVQNELINAALIWYNPEIVAATKETALHDLKKREAIDNEIAAQKGLKPYTLLNVEFINGTGDKADYIGWYYVTLAVDGKIFAHIETGLNHEIANGKVGEVPTKKNYFVAGALKEADVDFVFNNVGHSSTSTLHSFHISDDVRERAEKALAERIAADTSPAPERFSVIETDNGYAVWDDTRNEIYVDGESVQEEFTSEWQAEDYLKQVKKAVADKEAAERLAVERAKQEPAEREQVELIAQYHAYGETILIQQYPNSQYYIHYCYDDQDGAVYATAGGFDTFEEAEKTLYSHRPKAEKVLEPAEKAADTEKGAESLADGRGPDSDGPALPPPAPRRRAKVSPFVLHPEVPSADRHEYRITDDAIGAGTPGERFSNNVRAIRLLKKLESENRFATPEEQAVLAQYVGWGGLADCFDERHSKYAELKALLDEDEYAAARESTLTAFYTPPVVIRSIYQALENMGFKTGNLLEPSCGIGNFIGMRPENLSDSKIYGIELDGISGRIAQQLYQKSSIAVQGFEKTDLPDSFFDAAIGNVPFGSFKVSDKRYDKHNFLIHDYFFARTLDKVRPGGIIAFVTSKGTMDKESPTVRKYIAQRADLLGAIRLPNNTFKDAAGTEVTSDILFLQKRDALSSEEPAWVHLNTDENGLKMNQYFIDHPEMVMGEMREVSGPYGPETACLPREGQNLGEQLTAAIQNIQGSITEYVMDDPEAESEDKSIPADPEVRNFSYAVVDGQVYYRENSRMNPVEVSVTAANRIKGLIGIRDCVRTLIEYQTEDWPVEDIQAEQKKLNALYDAFAAKYGRINSRANSAAFSMDSAYFLLSSLEVLDDERNFVRKADMFTKRTIKQKVVVTSVDTASEALAVSLAEKACVDLGFMAALMGGGEKIPQVVEDLKGVIFKDPATGPFDIDGDAISWYKGWQTADEYLSGNVREKLVAARLAAENDPAFQINVDALEKVQPVDLTASEISVRLGADWLPVEVVQQFMYELFDTPNYAQWNIKVHHSRMTRDWNIEGKSYDKSNIKAHNTYGTSRINGYKIIEETLNLRDVRIFDYVEDADGKKTPVLNKKETAIAQGKQELIKQAFQDWIWKDPARRERLTRLYNDKFNSTRPREYDGSHLNFVGMNPEITLRPHQVNAIAHILYGGNTLLAHVVGAGKTFEMVAAAQESKRLGLCQKSLFVVPNHLTEQWAAEYLQLYPSANILVATKKDFETKNRKRFCGRIATGDYDAIIIGHSQFEKIPVSVERQRYLLEQQRRDVLDGIAELKANHGERFSIKQMERTRKSIDAKLEKLNDQSRKDDVVTFEELGVDRIFIDEAHYYKNLASFSKMRNVGGISQTEAQKSSDLYMKCRYLDELTGGRGVIFATGTPISNTMVEMFTMQKYLQYGLLEQKELFHFDAWASTFGETVTAMELAPEGYTFFRWKKYIPLNL